jgi:integrase
MDIGSREDVSEMEMAIADFIAHKTVEGLKHSTLVDMHGRLSRVCRECGFNTFADVNNHAAIAFFVRMKQEGRAAATLQVNRKYALTFFEWAVARGCIDENPITTCPKPIKRNRDIKKRRRALTTEELDLLVKVAMLRPLAERARRRTVGLKGRKFPFWAANKITLSNLIPLAEEARRILSPVDMKRCERDGRKWALIYKVLAFTGLRWGELVATQVKQFHYGEQSHLNLLSEQTKNGDGAIQPVPQQIADELRSWIKECKLRPVDALIPNLPERGTKRFHLDRKAAGIEELDKFGRSVDVHSLRYTYCTFLAKRNVSPRVIQKLLRHRTAHLSMQVYLDETQLDHFSAAEGLGTSQVIYEETGTARTKALEPPTAPKPESPPALAGGLSGGAAEALLATLVASMDAEAAKKALVALMMAQGAKPVGG